jgi:hypothetical protein
MKSFSAGPQFTEVVSLANSSRLAHALATWHRSLLTQSMLALGLATWTENVRNVRCSSVILCESLRLTGFRRPIGITLPIARAEVGFQSARRAV